MSRSRLYTESRPALIRRTAIERSGNVRNQALVGESGNKNLNKSEDQST